MLKQKAGLQITATLFFLAIWFNNVTVAWAEELFLTVLHTNDEHGALIPHSAAVDFHPHAVNPTVGGYARLATAVGQIREVKAEQGEPVLLFSAGDFIGGSPYSWLIPRGYTYEMEIMHKIGYDALVVGNHEFDYGPSVLADFLLTSGYPEAHSQTPILASNIVAPPEHPLGRHGLFRESEILNLSNGLRVGLFGLIGEVAASYVVDYEPLQFKDQHETARRMVEKLQAEEVDIIIAITHASVEEDLELAEAVDGIHLIVGGHSHTELFEPLIQGDTIVVQAGSLLKYLGCIELGFNRESGKLTVRNEQSGSPFLIRLDYNYQLDSEIEAIVDEATEELNLLIREITGGRFADVLKPIAYSEFLIPNYPEMQETPFGNFTTDAMRLVTAEKTGERVDFAVQANGSIRGTLMPGSMPHSLGRISFYDLAELVGLGVGPDGDAGYPIVKVYLTGDEIVRVLEVAVILGEMLGDPYFLQFSGLRYEYNPRNAILLTIPFLDLPVPSTRAVLKAERYTGEGRQGIDDAFYQPLKRGDDNLYALVTDSLILSSLPLVGELLPALEIDLKDQAGRSYPAEELDRFIVTVDDRELKVWQTVLEYAASQPLNEAGLPEIDAYYATTAARIVPIWSIPLIAYPALAVLLIISGLVYSVRRFKARR